MMCKIVTKFQRLSSNDGFAIFGKFDAIYLVGGLDRVLNGGSENG